MFGLESLGLLGLFIGTFLAATVLPFSSDVLYLAVLTATGNAAGCLAVGTAGNWLGSVLTYWTGWLGKWEWIERWFKVKPETLQRQKELIGRYGVWLALLAWVPGIGDIIAIALGFYRVRPVWTTVLLLIGKFLRFLAWNLIYGLF
ncbi:MAG: DedA family protein [Bacteroidales bacterium]|nr:DedA family protein [Bacteroidales bacterium]